MASASYAGLALVLGAAWLLYHHAVQWRYKRFAHVPNKLSTNFFLGHLGHIATEYKKAGNAAMHPDYILEKIWKEHDSPEFMFLDLRPFQHPMILVTSNGIAEQISRASKRQPYSVTKSPTIQGGFSEVVGRYSLLSADGEAWRGLRKTFNPGFAPQHLLSLLPVIIDKTSTFMEKLNALADSGIATEMEPYCTNVTFDIIGEVVTNVDFKAQDDSDEGQDIVRNFRKLIATFSGESGFIPAWMNLRKTINRYIYSQRLDKAIKETVKDNFAAIKNAQTSEAKGNKDRSVLALALKDVDVLTPEGLQSTADQVKTFLLAGHDTTSILLQRLLYVLSIHPACLAKVRAEHDAIFGDSSPREVFLARPDETMKALKYTSACIKETLRLWPPAGSARMSHNGFKLRTAEGDEVCVDECLLYICHHIIQRNPEVYGETANDFIPDRWIEDSDTSSATADDDASPGKIPISAWRPFERGPRNCIGQELANIEVRVILACVARRYDFIKVGLGEPEMDGEGGLVVDGKGRCKTKSELISTMSITSKPIDKTIMRVKLARRGREE